MLKFFIPLIYSQNINNKTVLAKRPEIIDLNKDIKGGKVSN